VDVNTKDWNQVLNVKFPDPRATPIFGVDPANDKEFLLDIETGPFDVWRYWLKADGRVLPQGTASMGLREGKGTFIHAPYFLRAAQFWKVIFKWCDAQKSSVGKEIRDSLETAFEYHRHTVKNLKDEYFGGSIPKTSCGMAILAVYAFTSGQGQSFRSRMPFAGLLGSYHAYGYYSSLSLAAAIGYRQNINRHYLIVAEDFLGGQQGMGKSVAIDLDTGNLVEGSDLLSDTPSMERLCFSSPNANPHEQLSVEPPQQDDFLNYLEEYARRLTIGQYRVDIMGTGPTDPEAIGLFPQMPTTPVPQAIISPPTSVPVVSRTVTRGIEVIGSAVYAREGRDQFGFIYCIRIRLLEEGEEGYQSASERGFTICQLQSRHWRITDDSTGQTSPVDGQGVIGMYPILREGDYSLTGDEWFEGVFQYQSCTGHMGHQGSFGGQIGFVPGHHGHPSGPRFMADLNPFLLDSKPKFLY
jgi:uncharacterized protein affecting Mg2+/Co2+ transport